MTLKGMKFFSIVVFAALTAGFAGEARGGWMQVDEGGAFVLISEGRVKFFTEDEDGMTIVSDLKSGEYMFVDNAARIYTRGSADRLCKGLAGVKAAKEMSTEHKGRIERMIGADKKGKAPKVSVKKAGSGGIIAGFRTEKYTVTSDGKLYEEVWITTDAALLKELNGPKGLSSLVAGMRKIEICLKDAYARAIGKSGAGKGMEVEDSKTYGELLKKGWLLRKIHYGHEGPVEREVLSMEKKKVSPSEFKPPSGYKEVPPRKIMVGF